MLQPLPFVGRQRELLDLQHRLAAARMGSGGLVLIAGEAGVGKSHLLSVILRSDGAPTAVTGRCPGAGEAPPYAPWLEVVTRLGQRAGLDPARLAPPLGTNGQAGSPFEHAVALADWFWSTGTPLVIALEDLHWADPASLELLRHLAPRLAETPVLLIATYRSDEVGRTHPLWTLLPDLQRAGTAHLALGRLSESDITEMVAAALPELEDGGELARRLHARTAGHALFVRDLLMAVVREGLVPAEEQPLPETVQQAIDSRLMRLGPNAQSALHAAAMIGEWFDYDLLAEIVDLSEEQLADALDDAVALRVIRLDEGSGDRFTFDHALVREVLISHLITPRRRRIHQRIAAALLKRPNPDPELVALHLTRAGDDRAPQYLIAAAEKASRMKALAQAGQYLEQALDLMPETDPARTEVLVTLGINLNHVAPERARGYFEEAVRSAEAQGDQLKLAWARGKHTLYTMGEYLTAEELLALKQAEDAFKEDDRVFALTSRLNQWRSRLNDVNFVWYASLIGRGAIAEAEAAVPHLRSLGLSEPDTAILKYARGDIAALQRAHEEIIACFSASPAWALGTESDRILFYLLHRAEEADKIDAFVPRYQQLEIESARTGYPYMPEGFSDIGYYQFLRGDWSAAHANMVGYLSGPPRPRRIDRFNRIWAALLLLHRGDLAGARAMLGPVPPALPGDERGIQTLPILQRWLRVSLHLAAGETEQASAWLDDADRWLVGAPRYPKRALIALTRAEYHQHLGDTKAARADLEQAVAWAEEASLSWALIIAYRRLGALAAGRPTEAEQHFQASLSLAERCRFPYEAALTRLVRSQTLRVTDDLPGLIDTFAGLGAAPALDAARKLLDELSDTQTFPDGLTHREVEVIRLVARGLTDKEVGEQLHISRRTVDAHLRHIFNKVGVSNRTTLATYAARAGLI